MDGCQLPMYITIAHGILLMCKKRYHYRSLVGGVSAAFVDDQVISPL